MEFVSDFHAFSSGCVDFCSYCLRISSSGFLVSGSGTGGGRLRTPSSLPPSLPYPAGFSPFPTRRIYSLSPRRKDLWVAGQMEERGEEWWRQQRYRTHQEQHHRFHRQQLQQQQRRRRQFRQRLQSILHPDRVSYRDNDSSSSIDSRSSSSGLGKSRSHLPSFMTKRIIRPRFSAPAAVVNDPSASALTDVSPSAGDRDNQSNLVNKATMPREAEEDGAVGMRPEWKFPAVRVRHRRRASYQGKRRHGFDTDESTSIRSYDICIVRISIECWQSSPAIPFSTVRTKFPSSNSTAMMMRQAGRQRMARLVRGETVRERPVSGAVDWRYLGPTASPKVAI